jgi:hypothetical protein
MSNKQENLQRCTNSNNEMEVE